MDAARHRVGRRARHGAFGPPPVWPEAAEPCWGPDTYARLAEAGLGYGPAFQGVRTAVRTGDGELLARLSLPSHARDVADPYPVHPALLDAALQVAAAFDDSGRVLLPVAVGRCELPPGDAADLIASVRRTGRTGTDITLDVALWDPDGLPVGRLEAYGCAPPTRRCCGAPPRALGICTRWHGRPWPPRQSRASRRRRAMAGSCWAATLPTSKWRRP
ncbi:polyketide synthase dehydratase domain-containing protein [Streptomyces sp. FXJ1.4098]|nr:polyketide synthase dehydratase domain-containing protein [Streptomyces sp. FXJ1.4098]